MNKKPDLFTLPHSDDRMTDKRSDLGQVLKQRRVMMQLALQELSAVAGVSSSHLGRIERGERFPSAHVLRKIAKPLGYDEAELLTLGGFLSPQQSTVVEYHGSKQLDPYVSAVLSQEPVEVQRTVVAILTVLKSMANTTMKNKENKS